MSRRLEESCSFDRHDWFYFNIISSPHCPIKNYRELMWEWTLPEVVKLAEYAEIRDAFETAHHKDEELKQKMNGNK